MKNQKGFTLVEMAIVMVIFGLLVATSATAYIQWQNWERKNTTQTNIETVYDAMQRYVSTNRRYPCPASLIANKTNKNEIYGLEASNAANGCLENPLPAIGPVALNGGANDMFIVQNALRAPEPYIDVLGNDLSTPPLQPFRVRIGAVPFRTLELDENQAFDGYRNRLMYVVTEHLTTANSFDPDQGAIRVVDQNNNELTNVPGGDVHFMVYSLGENGAGAFNREGVQSACPAGGFENENCDFNDDTFRLGDFSTAAGADALDDVMKFGRLEIPNWNRNPNGSNRLGGQRFGAGPVASLNPQEELDVTGIIRLTDDASTDDGNPLTQDDLEGRLKSETLCPYGSTNTDCFVVSAISGSLADGNGMTCTNTNEYIQGITNNSPNCSIVEVGCPSNKIIKGINASGDVDCGDPPVYCPSIGVTICGAPKVLPNNSVNGYQHTVSTTSNGYPVSQKYTCNSGSWTAAPQVGVCNCTPTVLPPTTVNDGCELNTACGNAYMGDTIVSTVVQCPSGNNSSTTDRSACLCDPSSKKTTTGSCSNAYYSANYLPPVLQPPAGKKYNRGSFRFESQMVCSSSTTGSCSPTAYKDGGENCGCRNGSVQTYSTPSCTNGYSGTIKKKRQFQCDGTDTNDTSTTFLGVVGETVYLPDDLSDCTCNEGTFDGTEVSCSSWQTGKIERAGFTGIPTEYTVAVVGGTCQKSAETFKIDPNTACENVPPRTCNWRAYEKKFDGTATRKNGDECSEQCGNIGNCENAGSIHRCACE